jgi:hydroxymethylglutaryl-CoA synthase
MDTSVGIEAISFDFPKLCLSAEEFSKARALEKDKLTKGLGIEQFSFPDKHQDPITLAANALTRLIEENAVNTQEIQRMYIGTESAVDSAKPIGSYLHSCLEEKLGKGSVEHWDTVDFTFACIGAVDALQTCLDYLRLYPEHKAIVIATDIAKYNLGSTGEYTQGAGAIALLLSANPGILTIDPPTGISTEGVFDFFKPRRILTKDEFTIQIQDPWVYSEEETIQLFKEQPVYDGAYSQQCYMHRTHNAYFQLKKKLGCTKPLYERWDAIIMHLPYCFQARRSFIEIFAGENLQLLENQLGADLSSKMRSLYKSKEYQKVIEEKIQDQEYFSGKIGNIYTGSIFLALLSYLYKNLEKEKENSTLGFIAYGSGSKSKAFEGQLVKGWQSKVNRTALNNIGKAQHSLSFVDYEALHKGSRSASILPPCKEWILSGIEAKEANKKGARNYQWVGDSPEEMIL